MIKNSLEKKIGIKTRLQFEKVNHTETRQIAFLNCNDLVKDGLTADERSRQRTKARKTIAEEDKKRVEGNKMEWEATIRKVCDSLGDYTSLKSYGEDSSGYKNLRGRMETPRADPGIIRRFIMESFNQTEEFKTDDTVEREMFCTSPKGGLMDPMSDYLVMRYDRPNVVFKKGILGGVEITVTAKGGFYTGGLYGTDSAEPPVLTFKKGLGRKTVTIITSQKRYHKPSECSGLGVGAGWSGMS